PFLAFTAFLRGTGLDLTYVPYRNPIAALPDLAEGRVDLAFLPLAPLIGPAHAGKLRLGAVASDARAPLPPDVPTARRAGFPTLSLFGGHGLFAPKEMPEPLRARIAGDLRATLADAEVARRLTAMGYIPRPAAPRCGGPLPPRGYTPPRDSPANSAAILDRERVHWTEVARMYGAKPPQ